MLWIWVFLRKRTAHLLDWYGPPDHDSIMAFLPLNPNSNNIIANTNALCVLVFLIFSHYDLLEVATEVFQPSFYQLCCRIHALVFHCIILQLYYLVGGILHETLARFLQSVCKRRKQIQSHYFWQHPPTLCTCYAFQQKPILLFLLADVLNIWLRCFPTSTGIFHMRVSDPGLLTYMANSTLLFRFSTAWPTPVRF